MTERIAGNPAYAVAAPDHGKTRIVWHDGEHYHCEIKHDRATNKLFVDLDGARRVIGSIDSGAQPPARARTTGEIIVEVEPNGARAAWKVYGNRCQWCDGHHHGGPENCPPEPVVEIPTGRKSHADGLEIAHKVIELLEPHCTRIEIAGSLRRGCAHVGDVEIVCVPKVATDLLGEYDPSVPHDVARALDRVGAEPRLNKRGHVIAWKERAFLTTFLDFPVDIFAVVPPAQWGAILAIRTGPSEFSRGIVTHGRSFGLPFDKGAIRNERGEVMPTPEERDVFHLLGLEWIEPADREAHRW